MAVAAGKTLTLQARAVNFQTRNPRVMPTGIITGSASKGLRRTSSAALRPSCQVRYGRVGVFVVTDAEILRIWNTLSNRTYTEARVFSCAVSAYENNGEINTGRAGAVMQVVWPQNAVLGAVPSEIRGRTANQNNNRNRQADFSRLMPLISGGIYPASAAPATPAGPTPPGTSPAASPPPLPAGGPPSRTEKLQQIKLAFEIGVVVVSLIGGIIALIWRSR